MSWDIDNIIVATPRAATVGGIRIAGGTRIDLSLSFQLNGWSWQHHGPLALLPQPGNVSARLVRTTLELGLATPTAGEVLHVPKSPCERALRFSLSLSQAALSELERARDGGSIAFEIQLVAHRLRLVSDATLAAGVDVEVVRDAYTFEVQKERWLSVLQDLGHGETLLTELRLPYGDGPDATGKARHRLGVAVRARDEGRYAESMRRCRISLQELEKAGFGGRTTDEVACFLKQNAGKLSQEERFAALRTALELFLSPPHHTNQPDEEYTREDAELAIAFTAAMLRMAPRWSIAGDGEPSK